MVGVFILLLGIFSLDLTVHPARGKIVAKWDNFPR